MTSELLNNLKIHKASGPDGLSSRVLKECSSEIAPILALIYNESLAQGTVPDDWRQANVAPIFKKGEKYDAANYRPVSLTCIFLSIDTESIKFRSSSQVWWVAKI